MMQVALSLLLLAQDVGPLKRQLYQACADLSYAGVKDAAPKLGAANSKAAADALLDGYDALARRLPGLYREKARWAREMENSKYDVDPKTMQPRGDISGFVDAQNHANEVTGTIEKIRELQGFVVDALAALRSDDALKAVASELGSKDWTKRAAVAEALGRAGTDAAAQAIVDALAKEPESAAKVAMVDALAGKPTQAVADAVGAAIASDPTWQVKLSGVKCLQKLGLKTGVPLMIEALKGADGRLKWEVNDVLKEITGVDKLGDYDAWKAWWAADGAKFLAGDYKPAGGAAGGGGGTATFYDIPIKSKRLLFILDRSGSMAEDSKWRSEVATGGADDGIKLEGKRKIDVARYNLKKAIASLPDGTEFDVLYYNQEVVALSPKLLKLDEKTRKQAFAWIDKLDPVGGTNIHDALEKGFKFVVTDAEGRLAKDSIDTIFFMTDGLPTVGQILEPKEILSKINGLNKLSKVRIHTVCVGLSTNPDDKPGFELLEKLAKNNDGTFKSTD